MKLRWLLAAVFILGAAYYALFGGDHGYFEVRRLARQRAQEQVRLQALQRELKQLQSRTDSLLKDPIALERLAREKYGLIRAGERLYRFVDSAGAEVGSGARNIPDRDTVRRPQPR
ncbi:MAG: FtsB family cell division protein [Longimicrobiales bacterium]